ncbi:MAG TPA: iron-containing alcohol dehydrogenase [Thermodesulfobacteriota bacterium]|nr:iron-containing alcohol dehydrogenase [Thermodesulfobacteriota bacterium]
MANPRPPISFQLLGASVRLGAGTIKEVGAAFQSAGGKKVLIITDPGVVKAGLLGPAMKSLEESKISYEVFDRIEPNPSDRTVMEGVQLFKRAGCDAILGVGGGSPLDASKAIQVMASHPGEILEYFGVAAAAKITRPRPYLIAIPTTSGTGSEVSRGAVITDTKTKTKSILRTGPSNLAILDPEMTLTMPPRLTAATGMDALSHHIEACVSNAYQPVCTALALEGIRLVARSLRKAVSSGDNLDARTDMAVASMMGALAFQKGLGAAHSLAHQLSTEADVHHGVANSILLPHVMRFNLPDAREDLVLVSRALGERTDSLPAAEGAERACLAVSRLASEIGLPQRLRDVGVKEEQIPVLAEKSMADWCHPFNPRPCSVADMVELYRAAF